MSERAIADPTEHGWVDAGGGKWVWGASGGGSYDDTEVRGLISDNSDRIDALEASGGGGSSLWTDNGDGTISYSGVAKASDFIAE